ncbi:class II fructose-bisphosphate aldolase [Streptomyces sp. YIM S03343]
MPMAGNLQIARESLDLAAAAHVVLETEVGVVRGEEDSIVGGTDENIHSTPRAPSPLPW